MGDRVVREEALVVLLQKTGGDHRFGRSPDVLIGDLDAMEGLINLTELCAKGAKYFGGDLGLRPLLPDTCSIKKVFTSGTRVWPTSRPSLPSTAIPLKKR